MIKKAFRVVQDWLRGITDEDFQVAPWALTIFKGDAKIVIHLPTHSEAKDVEDRHIKAGWESLGIEWANTVKSYA